MAEVLAVRLALSVAWKLFAPKSAAKLEHGDVASEKLRQLLLNEFQKLHEHLNALRRKELVAAVAFLETGYDLLHKDAHTCKEEFKKARDAALVAFGVVPEVADRILATKILILSAIHEFADNIDTARTLCVKYLSRLNSLPEVTKICQVIFESEGTLKSKLLGLTGKATRRDLLQAVADTNYCLWEFITQQAGFDEKWPRVAWEKGNIHPVFDLCLLRSSHAIAELDFKSGSIIAAVVCSGYVFAATSQGFTATEMLQNSILAIGIETGHVRHLVGHSGNVLSLATDGKHLFSSSYDKNIMVWNPETLECTKILQQHTGAVRSLSVSDKFLFSGSTDSTVCVWLVDKLELCRVINIGVPLSFISCSRKKFLFCLTALSKVQIWDVTKLIEEKTTSPSFEMTVDDTVSKLMTSENILFACSKNSIDLIKLGSLRIEGTVNAPGRESLLTGSNKFLICKEEKELGLWSSRTGKLVLSEKMQSYGDVRIDFIWSHEGSFYASYCDNSSGRMFIRKW